jgi:hypothetical protein
MAYVPQYIPTNTQVLQGTLNQYQQAYDTETARQNQVNDVYSAIPTTREYDTTKKNEVMGQFAKVTQDLDKKYNYDRASSQYAQELAKEITKLRGNPLWAHVQQKDELDKLRTNLIAQRGADYYENFNPNEVTLANPAKLQEWRPQDINDVKQNAALKAKEFASSWKGRTHDTKSIPGTIQYLDQWGAKNEKEAEAYLAKHPEELLSSIPEGFNPNDPRVLNAAKNAWISNAIGETKPSSDPDNVYLINERNSNNKADNPMMSFMQISNTGDVNPEPYIYQDIKKQKESQATITELDKRISIESNPNVKKALLEEKNSIELKLAEAKDVIDQIEKSDLGQKILKVGDDIITAKLPSIASDTTLVTNINQKLRDYFRGTTDLQRVDESSGKLMQIAAGAKVVGKDMIVPSIELGNKIGNFYNEMIASILPWSNNSVWFAEQRENVAKNLQTSFMELAKSLRGKPMEDFDGKIKISSDVAKDLVKENAASGKYGDIQNMKEGSPEMEVAIKSINKDIKKEFPNIINMVNDYESFYKGKHNYLGRGLDVIDKQINKTLGEGKNNQYVESTPVIGDITNIPKYNNLVTFFSNIFDRMKPIEEEMRQGNGKLWNPDALSAFKSDIQKNGADIRMLTNGDQPLRMALVSKGTNKRVTVELDESQSSTALIEELYSMTIDPRTGLGDLTILNQIYRDIKLSPNKVYKFEDFQPILSKHFPGGDLTGLENLAIEQTKENNALKYNLYINFNPSLPKNKQEKPVEFNNKTDLMMTLNQYKRINSNTVSQK